MNPSPVPPPAYSLQQLVEYFTAIEKLTGVKPAQVEVSADCLHWFRQQVKSVVKNFNIPTTKNYKKDMFMGVELVAK